MRKRKLRNGVAGGAGRIAHGDAVFFSILYIDVVHANAAADHKLEPARFLCRVDDGNAHLCGAAHNKHIILFDLLRQFGGLIKLFNNLVAFRLKRRDSRLIHSVGCKNTHGFPPYFLSLLTCFPPRTSS